LNKFNKARLTSPKLREAEDWLPIFRQTPYYKMLDEEIRANLETQYKALVAKSNNYPVQRTLAEILKQMGHEVDTSKEASGADIYLPNT
jgi:hypothetical protein